MNFTRKKHNCYKTILFGHVKRRFTDVTNKEVRVTGCWGYAVHEGVNVDRENIEE